MSQYIQIWNSLGLFILCNHICFLSWETGAVCVASTFSSLFLNLLSSNLSAYFFVCVFLPLLMFGPFTWFSRISHIGRMRWAAVSVHILHTSSVLSLSSIIVRFNSILFYLLSTSKSMFSSMYDPAVLCSIDSLSDDCKIAFSTPQSLTNIVVAVLFLPCTKCQWCFCVSSCVCLRSPAVLDVFVFPSVQLTASR